MAVVVNGLWAINFSGPWILLMKKEPLGRLKRTIIQNNANLPTYTHQQKICLEHECNNRLILVKARAKLPALQKWRYGDITGMT